MGRGTRWAPTSSVNHRGDLLERLWRKQGAHLYVAGLPRADARNAPDLAEDVGVICPDGQQRPGLWASVTVPAIAVQLDSSQPRWDYRQVL
jgi:hypothetical protein